MSKAAIKWEDLPHYTYEDYLQWEGSWELIHGIPYAMTPAPVVEHQRICTKITQYLGELLKDCTECEAIIPVDWQISEDTVVQPDVLIVCPGERKIGDEKLEITPELVFEVLSPSTKQKDKGLKYQLYQKAGVEYYCIVDSNKKIAEVFELYNNKYKKAGEFGQKIMNFDLGPCRVSFDFGKIFKLN